MNKLITAIAIMLALPFAAQAQTEAYNEQTDPITVGEAAPRQTAPQQAVAFRYGYVHYDSVPYALPAYAEAQKSVAALRQKYDKELKRAEDEFNAKYEDFLDGQRDFVPSILHKRQAELQDIMDKNTAFRKEAQRLLAQAEKEAVTPLRKELNAAIERVAQAYGLAFVLNKDDASCPYVNPSLSLDITDLVMKAMNKEKQ